LAFLTVTRLIFFRLLFDGHCLHWCCSPSFGWNGVRATKKQDEQHSSYYSRVPAVHLWYIYLLFIYWIYIAPIKKHNQNFTGINTVERHLRTKRSSINNNYSYICICSCYMIFSTLHQSLDIHTCICTYVHTQPNVYMCML